jgi:hypothetical protein
MSLIDQNLGITWVSLPVIKSNSRAYAELSVFSISGLVAHHSHKFQYKANLKKGGIDVGSPLISHLRAQRHANGVERLPS